MPFNRFLHGIYSWAETRMQYAKEEERNRFNDWLWAPPTGDPDRVTQDVIDDEMSLFQAARRQNGPGGG